MGQQHNELRRGGLNDAIRRALGAHAGGEGGVERFGETLTPTLDIWQQPEWAYLRGERLWSLQATQGQVVGEVSAIGVLNRLGSGALVVVESASFRTGSGAALTFAGWTTEALVLATLALSAGAAVYRDLRGVPYPAGTPAVVSATMVIGSDLSPTSVNTVEIERRQGITTETVDFRCLPVILPPGFGFVIVTNVANTSLDANINGRERRLFPGELST